MLGLLLLFSLSPSYGFLFMLLCIMFQLQAADQIKKLYNLFLQIDATQVEVNPFGETPEGQGISLFFLRGVEGWILI